MSELLCVRQDDHRLGGLATVNGWHRRWARRQGHSVREIFLADDTSSLDFFRAVGDSFKGDALPRLLPSLHAPQYLGGRRIFRGGPFDSAHVVGGSALHGLVAVDKWPTVVWVGTTIADERLRVLPHQDMKRRILYRATLPSLQRIEARVFRGSSLILAQSTHTAEQIVAGGHPSSKVEVLPVPIDTEQFRPGVGVRQGILFVGRANDPRKNFKACLDLLRSSDSARAEGLVAVTSQVPSEQLTRGLSDHIRLLSDVTDLAPIYRSTRLFLSTAIQEGFGIAIFEALASGTPVVVLSSGGPDRYVKESGGGVVVSYERDLVPAVEKILSDDRLAAEMGAAGRQWVERNLSGQRFLEDSATFAA